MDLHFTPDEPTDSERAAVDEVLGPPTDGWSGGSRDIDRDGRWHAASTPGRDQLLPVLHALQARAGWISPGALNYVCRRLRIAPADAYGVASFYGLFSLKPRPPAVIHVCDDLACCVRGSGELCRDLERRCGPAGMPVGGLAIWHRSPCLGHCERAPAAFLQLSGDSPYEAVLAPASAEALAAVIQDPARIRAIAASPMEPATSVPQRGQPGLRLLERIGSSNPADLKAYCSGGGYQALRHALEAGPDRVIQEIQDSGLVGRGGAAFPSGRKWHAVAAAPKPHFLVCNADESEPGTFKDRILLEGDPFLVIEAMTIAAFATRCEKGYLYLRGEYPLAAGRVRNAIHAARSAGLLGQGIAGSNFSFEIEIRRGAGAYICGEETALFNSLEGFRGEPRSKPPFPTERGLFGRPTLVNNVETLANVPHILLYGAARFAAAGTAHSHGHKLYCVSGHVAQPGLYEYPFGITLRELIHAAGGIAGSRRLQAVLVGGAAGSLLSPSELDVPLTFEGLRGIGAMLGSAVVMAFDDSIDLRLLLVRIAEFFRQESCGQCVPCRIGTVRQHEMMERLREGSPLAPLLFAELAQTLRDASICGLGQTAPNAIESAFARFPELAGALPLREVRP